MTIYGWMFCGLSWGIILLLTAFCFWQVFHKQASR